MLWVRRIWQALIVGGTVADIVLIRRRRGGTFSGAVAVDTFRTHTTWGRRAWWGFWAWFGWHIAYGEFVETPSTSRR